MAGSHNPHFRVLLGGAIDDFSDAEFGSVSKVEMTIFTPPVQRHSG
jgi:hypothetical protein